MSSDRLVLLAFPRLFDAYAHTSTKKNEFLFFDEEDRPYVAQTEDVRSPTQRLSAVDQGCV